jgi:hypothetical protein
MPKGTSGYLKPKKQTLKELDEVSGNYKPEANPIDRAMENQQREAEASKGWTERLRNIFEN